MSRISVGKLVGPVITVLFVGSGCSGGSDGDDSSGEGGAGARGNTGGSGGVANGGRGGTQPGGGGPGGASGGPQRDPNAACSDPAASVPGWIDITANVPGRGTGPMNSPIARCEREGDRFAVLAFGAERDEVDLTMMRVEVERGFAGPGAYSGSVSDGVVVDVYHSDVAGFRNTSPGRCTVCVNADESSGSFTCAGLLVWNGGGTMDVTGGRFTCSSVEPARGGAPIGESCESYACDTPSTGYCAAPHPDCDGGLCSLDARGFEACTAECSDTNPCPADYRCESVTGWPTPVCVTAAVCGNERVEPGEVCDAPTPAGRCGPECLSCLGEVRPAWAVLHAEMGETVFDIDEEVPRFTDPDCSRQIVPGQGFVDAGFSSCREPTVVHLGFPVPLRVGTTVLDGSTRDSQIVCVSRQEPGSPDRVSYCSQDPRTSSDPADYGRITVDEVLCDARGARGSLTADLVYAGTLRNQFEIIDEPERAGETIPLTATFELIASGDL